jgi:hypothetical protein
MFFDMKIKLGLKIIAEKLKNYKKKIFTVHCMRCAVVAEICADWSRIKFSKNQPKVGRHCADESGERKI